MHGLFMSFPTSHSVVFGPAGRSINNLIDTPLPKHQRGTGARRSYEIVNSSTVGINKRLEAFTQLPSFASGWFQPL